jgi:predicted phage tail protein
VLAFIWCASAVSPAAQTNYSVAWDANQDPYTVGYRLYGGTAPGQYTWSVDVGNATSAQLPPLPPGSTYYFVVRAYNAAGQLSAPSNEAPLDLNGRPGPVTGLAAIADGSYVTLSWSPPAGNSVTHYVVFVGTTPGAADLVNGLSVGNVLSVSGSLPPGRYYARVQAVNQFGPGAVSAEVNFVAGGPDQPGNPTGLAISWNGTIATLTWNPSAGATRYYIEAGNTSGSSNIAVLEVGAATRYVVDVPPGIYFVRVRAASAAAVSGPSNELVVQGRGAPERPTGLSASASSTVNLRWFAPTTGPAPTGYLLEAGSAPGLANLATLQVGPVTSFSTTAPPGIYYVRVRAVNGRGASQPSNEIIVRR